MDGFAPVLRSVRSRLIHVAHHAAGRDVALGGHYGISNAMTTGVVPVGMQHGMRGPAADQAAAALFRGRRVPVMGVSLEHTTLDLSALGDARLGEEVMLLGGADGACITVEEMAAWQRRTPLEVAMTFSRRLPVAPCGGDHDVSGLDLIEV